MRGPSPREPVARVDSAWLHMDDADNLMVVTLVLMFEQPIAYERIRELIETRLLKIPRFRQRIVPARSRVLSFGGPEWEEDPEFDIARHLEPVALDEPADEASLHRVVSASLSRPLDPSRPLWHFDYVPRYGEGSALVARIHHCIGDGLGLIYAFLAMSDHPESATASLCSSASAAARSSRLAVLARASIGGVVTTARLLLMSADRSTRLKGPLVVEKRATWSTPVPVDQVKAVSRTLGASVNDVLLTAVTGALRRYLASRGTVARNLNVRGVVPVNLRPYDQAHLLGNRFGLVFLSMPVGVADPAERLAQICRRMRAIKRSLEPLVTFRILWALGLAPRRVFDLVVRMFGRKATAVVTNVVGPREPITYAGVRMSQAMFWVPCAAKLGLGVSVLSYAGRVSVGFATDAGLIPDPERIVEGFDCELAGLLERAQARC